MKYKKDITAIILAIIVLLNLIRTHGKFSILDTVIIILLIIDIIILLLERMKRK